MPWFHTEYGGFIVSVDLDSIGIVSCNPPTIEVCGRVATKDGMFDQRICTKVCNSKSLAKALEEFRRTLEEEYCGSADNPEMCVEYYADYLSEMACDHISSEHVLPYIEMEELVEALVRAAQDHLPEKKGLLKWIKR